MPAVSLGLIGCLGGANTAPGNRPLQFDFGGVVVYSRPSSEQYQPWEVTVTIDRHDGRQYSETEVVDGVTHGVAFVVEEDWMQERLPNSIGVTTSAYEREITFTGRFGPEIAEKFPNQVVYFEFVLTKGGIAVHPLPSENLG